MGDSDRRTFLAAAASAGIAGLAGCAGEFGLTGSDDSDATAGTDATAELPPTWTTGEKYGVGTVPDHGSDDPSKVWFTLTEGALTEPRYPRVDLMNLRAVEFLVADADGGYAVRTRNVSRRDDDGVRRSCEQVESDALVYRHEFAPTADDRDWSLSVEYAADPAADAILLDAAFDAADGTDYDVYVLGATSVGNATGGDAAERRGADGDHALLARDDTTGYLVDEAGDSYEVAVALAAGSGFDWATVETAGERTRSLLDAGERPDPETAAEGRNVVLAGRVLSATDAGSETVALGFGADGDAALAQATASSDRSYATVREAYVASWRESLADLDLPESVAGDDALAAQYRTAVMTLRAVEDKTFAGAGVASPSVPWGDGVGAVDPSDYGYNFVWSRDLYQVATALEATGDVERATDAVEYVFEYQQDEDGFVPQNTYLDGRTRWGGEQMDNVAFPLVLAYQLRARHGVDFAAVDYGYENVRASAAYVARGGPSSEQERWEEEGGYSPSTIAAEIAGLACAAKLAADEGERADALFFLGVADRWRANVESWCATDSGTDDHRRTPYYFRVGDDRNPDDGSDRSLANGGPTLDERAVIDAGFLELVRLGVEPWDDDVVRNSLAEVDETIRVDTPNGPAWYRYNGDGYGEGSGDSAGAPWPVATSGKGRLWPIFTGERGEYELLAGTADGDLAPRNLLATMQRFANDGRMIPEQVWDRESPTAYGWAFGEGTGSATPLAWSMAQYVRLAHGIDAGEPVERPAFVADRYASGSVPERPDLSVSFPETVVHERPVTLSGRTDAAEVVVDTGTARETVTPEDGRFELELSLADGQNWVAVVAAPEAEELRDVGLAVERRSISYID